jgi:hypothetical protein
VKELDSYLNDHLAGSVGAIELLAHWAKPYHGKPLGAFFSDLLLIIIILALTGHI